MQLNLIILRHWNVKYYSMQRLLFSLIIFTFFSINSHATHVVGGDFHIEWLSPNTYNVKLRFYSDCWNGIVPIPTTMDLGVYNPTTHALVSSYMMSRTSIATVNLGDNCYTPPPTTCIEEGIFEVTVVLPDLPGGYYLQTQINARNALAMNVTGASGNGTMIWFAMIPDPAIGQNSSPDFGNYPSDAYFCAGNNKLIQYPVTDADGDSLVYSLVTPLDANSPANGNYAGSGSYPFYPELVYQANPSGGNFSLANMVGGTSPMTIDQNSGEIIAGPSAIGFFTFAVRVEEFRNGVKIGEVRRDVQYASLPCSVGSPPAINLSDSISVYVDDEICFDIEVTSSSLDSLYLHITSSNFDLQNNFIPPTISGNSSEYLNWMGSTNAIQFNTTSTSSNSIGPGNAITGVSSIPLRYCWTPECEDLDSIFHIDLIALVPDTCGNGIDTTTLNGDFISILYQQSESDVHVVYTPAPTLLNAPNDTLLDYGDELCISIYAEDSINFGDTLFIQPYSDSVNWLQYFQLPEINSSGEYYYSDFLGDGNDFIMSGYNFNGFSPSAIGKVGVKFCVPADCYAIDLGEYNFTYQAVSTGCGAQPVIQNSKIEFNNPETEEPILPNVFNPSSNAGNHVFKIKGTNDPCNEFMSVEIYNRWGKKVFESDDPYFQWDGTHYKNGNECKAGTYYVLINGEFGGYDDAGERKYYKVVDQKYINLVR